MLREAALYAKNRYRAALRDSSASRIAETAARPIETAMATGHAEPLVRGFSVGGEASGVCSSGMETYAGVALDGSAG